MRSTTVTVRDLLAKPNTQVIYWDTYEFALADGTTVTLTSRDPDAMAWRPQETAAQGGWPGTSNGSVGIKDNFTGTGNLSTHVGDSGVTWTSLGNSPISAFVLTGNGGVTIPTQAVGDPSQDLRATSGPTANGSVYLTFTAEVPAGNWANNATVTAQVFNDVSFATLAIGLTSSHVSAGNTTHVVTADVFVTDGVVSNSAAVTISPGVDFGQTVTVRAEWLANGSVSLFVNGSLANVQNVGYASIGANVAEFSCENHLASFVFNQFNYDTL